MRRPYLVALLSALLLAMQLQAAVHTLAHLGDASHPHDQGVQSSQDGNEECAVCALFAGAGAAAISAVAALPSPPASSGAVQPRLVPWTVAAPTFYFSRAPPDLL